MKKRWISWILVFALIFSNIGVQAAGDVFQTIAEAIGMGSYTDNTAKATESYEYEIVGSDGSIATVSVPAIVQKIYTKYTPDFSAAQAVPDGTYIIMGGRSGYNMTSVVTRTETAAFTDYTDLVYTNNVSIINNVISQEYADSEWEVTYNGTNYVFKAPGEEKYLAIYDADAEQGAVSAATSQNLTIQSNTNASGSVSIGGPSIANANSTGYLNTRDGNPGTWTGTDIGSAWYLYALQYDIVNSAVTEAVKGVTAAQDYEADTWNAYQTALAATEGTFATENAAVAAYNNLVTAVAGLTLSEPVTEVELRVGERFDLSDLTIQPVVSESDAVEGEVVTNVDYYTPVYPHTIEAQSSNLSSFSGTLSDTITLSDAEVIVTSTGAADTYKVQQNKEGGKYIAKDGDAQIKLVDNADTESNQIKFVSDGNGKFRVIGNNGSWNRYIYFYASHMSFNTMSTDSETDMGYRLTVLEKQDELSDDDYLPGYKKVSAITSGKVYVIGYIWTAENTEKFIALYANQDFTTVHNDNNKKAMGQTVLAGDPVVNTTYDVSVLANAEGNATVTVGQKVYNITVVPGEATQTPEPSTEPTAAPTTEPTAEPTEIPEGITKTTKGVYSLVQIGEGETVQPGTYLILSSRFHRALLPENNTANNKLYLQILTQPTDYANEVPPSTIEVTEAQMAAYKLDWEISKDGDNYYIKNAGTNGYLRFTEGAGTVSATLGEDAKVATTINRYTGSESHAGSVVIGQSGQYLNMHGGNNGNYGGYDQDYDGGSAHYLYEKQADVQLYEVDTAALQNLVTEYTNLNLQSANYTADSWAAYNTALTSARTLLDQDHSFEAFGDAVADKASVDSALAALQSAKAALVKVKYTMKELYEAICKANAHVSGSEDLFLYSEEVYTPESGMAYREALKAARGTFATSEEAVTALENLKNAVKGLTLKENMKSCFPEIEWEVTEDVKINGVANYVEDLLYTNKSALDVNGDGLNDFEQYEALNWEWSQISKLVNDQEDKVSPIWSTDEKGLSYRKFASSLPEGHDFTYGSVYKISGIFEWPENYDLKNTTVVLDSKNDFYYRDIYEYLSENNLEEYFPLGQVLPINDDVYVVLWAEEDENSKPTVDTINDYLAFWAGTSGKGVWSQKGYMQDDWGRTEPATFIGYNLQGERTFRKSYPNIVGTEEIGNSTAEKTAANNQVKDWDFEYMTHTDGWYTLMDTTSVNNVLRSNYGEIEEGTKVHIDLYVMNNSGEGFIDELEIELFTTEHHDVTVNYYLNEVAEDMLLGSEQILNVADKEKITLLPGVKAGQLNSYKAEAIAVSGYKEVSNGVQQEPKPFTMDASKAENIINVVYTVTGAVQPIVKTYDFGVKNYYSLDSILNDNEKDATVTMADGQAATLELVDGKQVLCYEPTTVNRGERVELTLTFENTAVLTKEVRFVPASNVLYGEQFMKMGTDSVWKLEGDYENHTVSDNDRTTHGYTDDFTDATYTDGGVLKATLDINGTSGITGITAKSDALTFTFRGTGFDLLSACGPNTGMIVAKVTDVNNKVVRSYLVDTYFTGDFVDAEDKDEQPIISAKNAASYQVPVVRNLNLPYGTYTVTVYGYLLNTSGAIRTFGMDDAAIPTEDIVMTVLEDLELYDINVEDVEVSFMNEDSVLNGGAGNLYAEPAFGGFGLRDAAEDKSGNGAGTAQTTADIFVDGFRIYHPLPTEQETTSYVEKEQGVTYHSVYEFIKTSVNDLGANSVVYIEYDGNTGTSSIADYKIQGPQNEVYLTGGNSVAFAMEGYNAGDVVQIGAKLVTPGAKLSNDNGATETQLYATEMYYPVTVQKVNGMNCVVIKNTGAANTVLSISTLKVSENIGIYASAEIGQQIIETPAQEGETNEEPDVKITTAETVLADRYFAVRIETSKDVTGVDLLIPGGVTIALTAENAQAVAEGAVDVYRYSHSLAATLEAIVDGRYTFTVIAHYADGTNTEETVSVAVQTQAAVQ